ncbi:MAG: GDSL-type esterase/lipase family protein [Clostridia bacterium]|nr:GDSL-type esterase/lipase family protein [Clostridia bacterium]
MNKKLYKVMFTGDSVTDAGSLKPVGDGINEVGTGYVSNIMFWSWADHPDMNVRIMNSAISGNTSVKLIGRFDDDVLSYSPDVVYILIGINDVRRFVDENMVKPEYQISISRTFENLSLMIEKCQKANSKPIVISPLFFDLNKKDDTRKLRDELDIGYKNICNKYNVEYIDVQVKIDKYMKKGSAAMLSADRIHPSQIANVIIADTIYNTKSFKELFD